MRALGVGVEVLSVASFWACHASCALNYNRALLSRHTCRFYRAYFSQLSMQDSRYGRIRLVMSTFQRFEHIVCVRLHGFSSFTSLMNDHVTRPCHS